MAATNLVNVAQPLPELHQLRVSPRSLRRFGEVRRGPLASESSGCTQTPISEALHPRDGYKRRSRMVRQFPKRRREIESVCSRHCHVRQYQIWVEHTRLCQTVRTVFCNDWFVTPELKEHCVRFGGILVGVNKQNLERENRFHDIPPDVCGSPLTESGAFAFREDLVYAGRLR